MPNYLKIATILIAVFSHFIGVNAEAASKNKSQNSWAGSVTHVTDGDTLWIKPNGASDALKVRIDGIDAPEICQTYGVVAKQALQMRLAQQRVHVKVRSRDGFGRLLAQVKFQSEDVGQWMVASGHAWAHSFRSYKVTYGAQQKAAQQARRGLFAQSMAEHPRNFRKRHGSCKY